MDKMDLIDLAVLSEERRYVLLLVEKKPGSFEEIKSLLDISPASLRLHLNKLLDSGLLEEENGEYRLSGMAMPIIENLKGLMDSLTFFEENLGYWKKHDLTPVPDFLLRRLEELGRFDLIEADADHMFELPQTIREYLEASEEITAFFSCLNPEIPYCYSELVKKDLKLSLCVTEPLAEKLFYNFPDETKKLLESENKKLFVCNRNINLPGFLLTDRFMVIRLFQNNGSMSNQFIICSEDGALHWGRELYRHYKGISKPLEPESLGKSEIHEMKFTK